jgi:cytochrome c biogenesis protein CcmG/thiol:disulfide interchange protein DsbE
MAEPPAALGESTGRGPARAVPQGAAAHGGAGALPAGAHPPGRTATPRWAVAALLVAAAAGGAYLAGLRSVPVPSASPQETAAARRPAPAFALPSLRDDRTIALEEFRGQVVVINFFASWCKPCELEAADLQRTWEAVQGQGVVLLGIAMQDREEDARQFLRRHGLTYPAAFDRDNRVADAYRITGIPTTVFVDPWGRLAGRHVGVFVGTEGRARLQARIDAARRSAP